MHNVRFVLFCVRDQFFDVRLSGRDGEFYRVLNDLDECLAICHDADQFESDAV